MKSFYWLLVSVTMWRRRMRGLGRASAGWVLLGQCIYFFSFLLSLLFFPNFDFLLPPYLPILLVVPTVCYSAHHASSILGKDKEAGTGILTAHFCTTNRLLPFYPAIAQTELDFVGGSFLFWQTLEKREACTCVQGCTHNFLRPPHGFADTCPQRTQY